MRTLLHLLAPALLLAACVRPPVADEVPRAIPRPTEHRLDEGAEREHKASRKRWIESMHKAAEGVDWRAIERQNQEREEARRRAWAQGTALIPSRWSEVGSKNQAGRMHCVQRSPSVAGRLYAGSSLGGVWLGNENGTGWTPIGDNLAGGAHWIEVLPPEVAGGEEVVLVANDGGKVSVTRDRGESWAQPAGLPALSSCRGMAKLATTPPTLLVYGQYNPGSGTRPGLFASTDGGRTFANRWTGNANHPGGIWVPRIGATAATDVYILHRGQVLKSNTGGTNPVVVGTLDATATQGWISGSEAGAPQLYAIQRIGSAWRLYSSSNAGASWSHVHTPTDVWEGTLCASITNPQLVAYGGVETWRSTNGGATFAKVNNWGDYYGNPAQRLHADIPGIFALPNGAGEIWYVATDGGLYESRTQLATVQNLSLSGLGVSQYYSTHTSRTSPTLIVAGAQDQGYQRGYLSAPTGSGPSTNFAQLISGDYGHLTSSDGTHNLLYSVYPGFVLVQQGEANPQLLSPYVNFPSGATNAWLPPIHADPTDPTAFFFCGNTLWRHRRTTFNNWPATQWTTSNLLDGGATYVSQIAFAPSNAQRAYCVNNAGRVYRSLDRGVTWTLASSSGPAPHYFYGNALAVHPTNPDEAVVGGSGYSTVAARRTTDGGATWTGIGTGLPSTLIYDLAYGNDGSVFAATEAGPYRWHPSLGSWQSLAEPGLPITVFWSVEVVDAGATARFATYGRGIWDWRIGPPTGAASFAAYGTGLGGANILSLDTRTLPILGTTVVFDVVSPNLGARSGILFNSTFGGSASFGGGTVLCDPVLSTRRFLLDDTGMGQVRFAVPNDPTIVGTTMYFQAMVFDPTVAQGYAFSNGLEASFGH
ncbi:MAG: hypothetical protein ACK57N_13720 [Planctomycetia bacterium]